MIWILRYLVLVSQDFHSNNFCCEYTFVFRKKSDLTFFIKTSSKFSVIWKKKVCFELFLTNLICFFFLKIFESCSSNVYYANCAWYCKFNVNIFKYIVYIYNIINWRFYCMNLSHAQSEVWMLTEITWLLEYIYLKFIFIIL